MATLAERLARRQIQSALTGSAAAQSALVASWRRSMRLYGLNPGEGTLPDVLTEQELKEARERLGSLIPHRAGQS